MFLNSIFSSLRISLKQKSSFLVATTIASATVGAIASYYLFKSTDNKEELENLNEDLKVARQNFEAEIPNIKNRNSEERSQLIKEAENLKILTECIAKEMKEHDENYTSLGVSIRIADIDNCSKKVAT